MATTAPQLSRPAAAVARPRRWPALVLVALGVACYFVIYLFWAVPDLVEPVLMPVFMVYMLGPAVCAVLLAVWWLVAGPARLRTRLLVAAAAAATGAAAWAAAHPTARDYVWMQGIPGAVGAAALALLLPARLPSSRAVAAAALGVAALLPWGLIRAHGVTGTFSMDWSFRWVASAEEAALAYDRAGAGATGGSAGAVPAEAGASDWPGFRGPKRDGVAPGGAGDWAAAPPREVWRHPVGPAWSSVCVVGDRLFTQGQYDQEERVVCYHVVDGRELWRHAEANRHEDRESGPGPRATPTFHDQKVYALGAKGVLVCLDAGSGKLVWRADLKETSDVELPMWGVACSPLVAGGKVIVHPGFKAAPRLRAFDAADGKPAWSAGAGADGYSSPHLATLAGVPQVLIFASDGLSSHDPATGQELWHYEWKSKGVSQPVTQPLLLARDRVVFSAGGMRMGTRCVQVSHGSDGWSWQDLWETKKFNPGFNDFVHHSGSLYGLEMGRLVCLDAATGKERWRSGSYGAGQVLLAGDKLLVQAEDGHLVLVQASPDGLEEVAAREALGDKTWNHPVIANGRLFVRNDRELVCFDLGGR